jgi:hypothetical protein
VKLDVGALLTSIVCVVVDEQAPVVRVNVTVLVPVVDHETLCGPTVEAVAGVAPAPKFQLYNEPGGADPAKLTAAVFPIQTEAGKLNAEFGGATTFTV